MAEKSPQGQELEIKLLIADLPALEARLQGMNAQRTQARIYEVNLRFDTPEKELTRASKVLRLRKDEANRMTYKGPSEDNAGVRARREIEFSLDDFEAGRELLEALGYQVSMIYEKYRTAYQLESVEVSLDELPYGNFAEIEGPQAERIHTLADELGLDWAARIPESYTTLFDRLKNSLGLAFRDLTFENFEDLDDPLATFNFRPADRQ